VEELRIGSQEGDPATQFGMIVAIDVDSAGRIHILDQQAAQVRVFDSTGKHVRTIGRPGTGPGELSPATMAVLAGPADVVYVADIMRQRIVALGADGSETGSTPMLVQRGIPMRWDVSPEGVFLLQLRTMTVPGMTDTVPMHDRIVARDPKTEQADTLIELESGRTIEFTGGMPRYRLFESEPVWAVLLDGRLAHGRNDTYRIELLDNDGAVKRVITRPGERRPVTEADRTAILAMMRQAIERQVAGRGPQAAAMAQQIVQTTQFADHYPVFAALLGGPGGTLWVQRIRTADDAKREGGTFTTAQDIGASQWDVFDAEGRLLGMLQLPTRFQPLRVQGEHIYGVLRDELDVQHVVRLRIAGLAAQE
jgi:hypothetical protein